jgi:hypothetical protein
MVEKGAVHGIDSNTTAQGIGNAVVFGLHPKAAAFIAVIQTSFIHMNVAGAFQYFADRIQPEVIHLLPGDNGDGLRRFAQGEGELGGGCGGSGGVGAGVFRRGVALALAGNGDGGKGGFFLCGGRSGLCFGLGLDGGCAILLGEQ